jgi:hypothetical protein
LHRFYTIKSARLSPVRMGPLGKPLALPSTSALSRTSIRMSSHSSTLQTPTPVYTIRVWSYATCDQSNDQQVSSGQNLKGLDKIIIIMIYTKHNH